MTFSTDTSGNLTVSVDPAVIESLTASGENTIPVRIVTPSASTDGIKLRVWNVSDSSLQQMITLVSPGFSWAEASMMLTFDLPTTETGSFTISKTGMCTLTEVDDESGEMYFHAYQTPLPKTVFQVTNTAPITDQNGNVLYDTGEYSFTAETGSEGDAVVNDIPVGEWEVTEISVPVPYILSGETKTVTVTKDEMQELHFIDDHQTAKITVLKLDDDTEEPLSGAVFGLYAAERIKFAGMTVFAQDALIETVTTGEDGTATFISNLPVGYSYYIIEEEPPEGYDISDTGQIDFTPAFDETTDAETIELTYEFRDTPTSGDLSITKRLTGTVTEPARQFFFTVTIEPPEDYTGDADRYLNCTLTAVYKNADENADDNEDDTSEGTVIFTDGVSTEIRLCVDQTVTIQGLPAGWTYSVEEDLTRNNAYSLYSWENDTGTIESGTVVSATCTNSTTVTDRSDIEFPETGDGGLRIWLAVYLLASIFSTAGWAVVSGRKRKGGGSGD